MKKHITYMDCETGEITENHEIAMIWYRKRHNIALMFLSPFWLLGGNCSEFAAQLLFYRRRVLGCKLPRTRRVL